MEKQERKRVKEKREITLSKMLETVCDHTQSSLLTADKPVYNLSCKILTTSQNKVLSRGWKFCIERRLIEPLNIQTEIEYNINTLKTGMEKKKVEWSNIKEVKSAAIQYMNITKNKLISNLSNDEILALKELKEVRSIVILRADKGNAVVIMDKKDYITKVEEILSDKTKFNQIEKDQ